MSVAEIFLMVWAGSATAFGVWAHGKARQFYTAHKLVATLVAELATGEIKATQDSKGVWTVENDDMKMQFLSVKRGNHGIQE
jgi:hypothetical protein